MPCRSPRGGWYSSIPCRSPGPNPGKEVEGSGLGGLQAHTWGEGVSQHALRQTPPPQQTATAAGGTHPTGMHSCCKKNSRSEVTLQVVIIVINLWH